MLDGDWSSDVCSSDLLNSAERLALESGYRIVWLDVTPSVYFFKEKLNFLWYGLAVLWKNLFADEFIIQARKRTS
jgi:hypothetical protein